MKKFFLVVLAVLFTAHVYPQNDSVKSNVLNEVTIVSTYRVKSDNGSLLKTEELEKENTGKEPCFVFSKMPSVFAYGDNGSEFGYGYMRIRGLDQTRINVTLDGMPWNEAEDFGCYFANSPDLMSSMHSIKVERGASVSGNGTAAYGGNVSLESANLKTDTNSSLYLGYGSFNSRKISAVYNMGIKKGWGLHIKATTSGTDGYKYHSYNNSHAITLKTGYFFNERHSIEFLTMNGFHKNGQGYEGVSEDELGTDRRINGCSVYDIDLWKQTVDKIQYNGVFENFVLNASVYYSMQDGWYNFDLDNYMRRMVDKNADTTNSVYTYGLTHQFYGANIVGKYYIGKFMLNGGLNAYRFDRRHYLHQNSTNVSPAEYYDNNGRKNDMNAFFKVKYEDEIMCAFGNIQYRYVDFAYTDNADGSKSFAKEAYGTYWNFINYDFGLDFNVRNDKLYFRYANVGREPMRSDMFGGNEWFPDTVLTNTPETVRNIEAGYEFSREKFKSTVDVFYMHFNDELVLNGSFSTNGLPLHENVDDSYKFGLEFAGTYRFDNGIALINSTSVSKNIMYNDYKYVAHTYSPNFLVNQDVEYTVGRYRFGTGISYRSKMYIDLSNEHSIDGAISLNVFAMADFGKLTCSVRMNNVTNNENFCGAVIGAENKMMYLVDVPFNAWFDIRYNF